MAIIIDIRHQESIEREILSHPVWQAVFDWLINNAKNTSRTGDHVITESPDFPPIKAIIKELPLDPEMLFEAHRKFIDVHMCLKGHEIINVTSSEDLLAENEYDAASDALLIKPPPRPYNQIVMLPYTAAILFPSDIHQPLQPDPADTALGKVVKAIVKVPVDAIS